MKRFLSGFAGLGLAAFLGFAASFSANALPQKGGNSYVEIKTKDGVIKIHLRADLAPKHVAQIETLTKRGFYNGVVFHRVIAGFMAQTGDPTGTGTGGSDLPDLPAEFSKTERFVRGTVGMARSSDPNSANSQFFIMFAPTPSLDGKYTIVGEVVSGMEVVDKIKKGSEADNGTVTNPDKIIEMRHYLGDT